MVAQWFASFTTVEQLRDFLEIPIVIWQMLTIDADKVVLLHGITFKEGGTERSVLLIFHVLRPPDTGLLAWERLLLKSTV